MKTEKSLFRLGMLGLAVVMLAGCSNVKQQLGVGRHSPDEFTVVKRAPLSLPPEYNLRPPGEGEKPAQTKPRQQARTIILGASESTVKAEDGEEALLQKAGFYDANPEIRKVIDRENGYVPLENQSVAEKLIFWKNERPEPTTEVVNAKAEAARLKQNREEGKPLNEGDVPVIKRKQSTIQKLF